MNLERGFRRLTWVVSLLFSVPLVGFGLLSIATSNTGDGPILVFLGIIAVVLSWATFFTVRWIVRGFQEAKTPDPSADTTGEEKLGPPVSWWRNLLRPIVKPFQYSYMSRPHGRHPALWKDSWGNHSRDLWRSASGSIRREGS